MTIDDLFSDDNLLPTVPKVVFDLVELLRDEDSPTSSIAKPLELDQVLAAKVLRMANSPFFGVRRKIVSVQSAVQLLGFSAIRSLVISSGLAGTFKGVPGVDLPAFWSRSLRVASTSRYLAAASRSADPSLAFTVGSMYAIGHVVMAQQLPNRVAALNVAAPYDSMQRPALELQEFGFHFGQVGARLATRWDFAQEMVDALDAFVSPQEAERFDPLANLLHLAVWRVALESYGDGPESRSPWALSSADAVGVSAEALDEMPAPSELAADLEAMIA